MGVQVLVPSGGIPVTGAANLCPATSIPATGLCQTSGLPVNQSCNVQPIPVTGGCGVSYIPITGIPVTGYCSNPHLVVQGETLSVISRACGTSVPVLLALNPSITNPNLIYAGQLIWLYQVDTSQLSVPVTGGNTPLTATVPVNPVVLNPSVMPIPSGTRLQVKVSNFPANTPVNIGVGKPGSGYQVVNTAITDANGSLQSTAVVPSVTGTPDQWTVIVITTTSPTVQSQSQPFIIDPTR